MKMRLLKLCERLGMVEPGCLYTQRDWMIFRSGVVSAALAWFLSRPLRFRWVPSLIDWSLSSNKRREARLCYF